MKWIFFMLSLFALSFPAFSFNSDFLHDSAARTFDSEDWTLLNAAGDKALQLPNGKKAAWKNPKTGHEGTIQPLNKINKNGTTCRDLRIFNRDQHNTDRYVFMFCKYKEGWKIVR
jgi:17 kDa outer membrane surface antigen